MEEITRENIVFIDDAIVVAVKPRGYVSEEHSPGSLPDALAALLGGGSLYPVHRLDKDTQGLIVYARTSKDASALNAAIREGSFRLERYSRKGI